MSSWFTVFSTTFGSDDDTGGIELVKCDLRQVGETEGSDAEGCVIWAHGPVVYRPDDPDADGECQAFTLDIAGTKIILGSRDTRILQGVGQLSKGDAMFSGAGGKARLITKKNGAISLYQTGTTVDAYVGIDEDGSLVFGNEWGAMSLGPAGFSVILATGQVFSISPDGILAQAPTVALKGAILLGMAPTGPVALATLAPSPSVYA